MITFLVVLVAIGLAVYLPYWEFMSAKRPPFKSPLVIPEIFYEERIVKNNYDGTLKKDNVSTPFTLRNIGDAPAFNVQVEDFKEVRFGNPLIPLICAGESINLKHSTPQKLNTSYNSHAPDQFNQNASLAVYFQKLLGIYRNKEIRTECLFSKHVFNVTVRYEDANGNKFVSEREIDYTPFWNKIESGRFNRIR